MGVLTIIVIFIYVICQNLFKITFLYFDILYVKFLTKDNGLLTNKLGMYAKITTFSRIRLRYLVVCENSSIIESV